MRTKNAGVDVFFTHPYRSTERGSVENLNGLARYDLPKRKSFSRLTQIVSTKLVELLDHRPREYLA